MSRSKGIRVVVIVLATLAIIEAAIVTLETPDGGTTIHATLVGVSDAGAVQRALAPLELDDLEVRHVGREAGGDRFEISCAPLTDERQDMTSQKLDEEFELAVNGSGNAMYSSQTVSPGFTSEFRGVLVKGAIIVDLILLLVSLVWVWRAPAATKGL